METKKRNSSQFCPLNSKQDQNYQGCLTIEYFKFVQP